MREKIFLLMILSLLVIQSLFAFPEIPLDYLKIAPIQKNSLFSLLESSSLLRFSTTGNLFEGLNWESQQPFFESDEWAILFQKEWNRFSGKMAFESFYQTKDSFQQIGSLMQWDFSLFDLLNLYGKKKALFKGSSSFAFTHSWDPFLAIEQKAEKLGWRLDHPISIANQITHLIAQGNLQWDGGGFLCAIDLVENELYPTGVSQLNLLHLNWKMTTQRQELHLWRLLLGLKEVNPYYQKQLGFFQDSRVEFFMQLFYSFDETYQLKSNYSHRTSIPMNKIGSYLPFENRFDLQFDYHGNHFDLEWLLKGIEKSDSKGEREWRIVEKLKSSYRFCIDSMEQGRIELDHAVQFIPLKKNWKGEVKLGWESIFKEVVIQMAGSCFFQKKEANEAELETKESFFSLWKVHFLADFIAQLPLPQGKIHLAVHLGTNQKREIDNDGEALKEQLDSLRWGKNAISCAIYYKHSF